MTSRLIVTVDTEEEGLWSGEFRRAGNTVENIHGVSRFQAVCDSYGVRPTYLVDAPVVECEWAVELLQSIAADNRCEIGTHVHPWCNPPFTEEVTTRNSYLCNLPSQLQFDKIEWLTDKIAERFGSRPTSFRAGRYGMDLVGVKHLAALGYSVDSSVIPFSDYRAEEGPDFREALTRPYRVGPHSLLHPAENAHEAGLWELPVTVGYTSPAYEQRDAIRRRALASPTLRRLRVVGILDRLRIARRVKLSPEQANGSDMARLMSASIARGDDVCVLLLHSTSLAAGFSPYASNPDELEELYRAFEQALEAALELGMRMETLTEAQTAIDKDRVNELTTP